MDWITLISAIGGSSAVAGLFSWLSSRKINEAQAKIAEAQAKINNSQADSTAADYAAKIIEQADKRVAQYETDAENARADRDEARAERDKWQEECRGQRKAKQEWRSKYEDAVSRIHELELENKDKDAKLAEADWHRCETNGCVNRIPPRKREITKTEEK